MRTNIDIDDELMAAAMAAGPFKTKREAVEAGLALLKRQADYARLLALKGQLRWGWDDEDAPADAAAEAREPKPAPYKALPVQRAKAGALPVKPKGAARGRR
jgi:antitoxin ParD1/3/4